MTAAFISTELDTLVYWIVERDRIRAAKEAGQPKPWTTDPLLRDYRWCNVRRMDDRVSQWLYWKWYDHRHEPSEQLLDAVWGRLINWPDALEEIDGARDPDEARSVLLRRAARGDKVFTGAYVVPGVSGRSKIDSVCDLVATVAAKADAILKRNGMASTWGALTEFDGIGSFLAGQMVADIAHNPLGHEWSDRATWAPVGPGSARGINRLLGRPKDKSVRQAEFDRLLPQLITVLRPRVSAIWDDRKLEAMDAQNCLCEFDRYRRLTLGEGQVRARYDGGSAESPQAGLL